MNENIQEKSLVKVNNKSIFYKIKRFLKNIFSNNNNIQQQAKEEINSPKNKFLDNIKNIENDETLLLKLQERYRLGEVKEEDLTIEQIDSLCNLYDKQIAKLRESNQIRKQKLEEYRSKLQTNN